MPHPENTQRSRHASNTPPGWYPDPLAPQRWRYWDGTAWTPRSKQAMPAQARSRRRVPIGRRLLVTGGFAALVWVVTAFALR